MRNPRTEAGASNGLGSQLEDPTRNVLPTQPDPLDPISMFAPWAGEPERGLRVRMYKARDIATKRARSSRHMQARLIYSVAAELASDWVFRRCEFDELERVLRALSQSFLAAGNIEAVEAPDEW